MPRMNNETKLVFALEHIAHLEDLIKDNEWEAFLTHSLIEMKVEFERQLSNERARKDRVTITTKDGKLNTKVN